MGELAVEPGPFNGLVEHKSWWRDFLKKRSAATQGQRNSIIDLVNIAIFDSADHTKKYRLQLQQKVKESKP